MIENTRESQKIATTSAEFYGDDALQRIYDEAELKYGPGFAQSLVDDLMKEQESPKVRIAKDQQMNTLIRLTNQFYALSQVCSAEFFHAWSAEDKVFYMTILRDVSSDLSQALYGSLKEMRASNDQEIFGEV